MMTLARVDEFIHDMCLYVITIEKIVEKLKYFYSFINLNDFFFASYLAS